MATPDSGAALDPDQLIGNYRVIRILGQGGMGQVYEALHDEIGRSVAIKVLHPEVSGNPDLARRFLNEARAVNRIGHPGLVEAFDFGRLSDGRTYIVMEFLEGETLARRLGERRTLPEVEAVRLVRGVAQALAATHAAEIVHRDLKPENIMIVPDREHGGERTKVLDFGIAKMREGGTRMTRTSAILGTAVYMAPEQCRGSGLLDEKADVYALGVILYEVLAGDPPFLAEEEVEIMTMHLRVPAPPLKDAAKEVSEAVGDLVARMLSKSPSERPTMAEVAQALMSGEGSGSLPAKPAAMSGQVAQVAASRPELRTPTPAKTPRPSGQVDEFAPTAPDAKGPTRSSRLRAGRIAAGGLLGAAVAGGLWIGLPRLFDKSPATPAPAAQDLRPMSAPAVPASDLQSPPDLRPASIRWSIVSTPQGAEVREAETGRLLGMTPMSLERSPESGTLKIRLQKAGYFSKTLSLDKSKDQAPPSVSLIVSPK